MTTVANELEVKPTSKVRMSALFQMLIDRDWWIGTTLQCVTPNPKRFDQKTQRTADGPDEFDRIRIVRVQDTMDIPLKRDGTFDVPISDPRHGKACKTECGIITRVEYPPGGQVTAFSLNCRDWEEVRA